MFRSIFIKASPRFVPSVRTFRYSNPRNFSSSLIALKKKGKDAGKDANSATTDKPFELDMNVVSDRFQQVIDKFTKVANESKMGKNNVKIFDHLQVHTPDGDLPYPAVAQTSLKGRNFMLTVFDPANVKHVVNAVLASDLNMNPIADPTSKQMLKIPLPPVTTESKKENIKQLKIVFEKYKNGPSGSGKNANTLAAIRGDVKNKISKKKKMTDAELEVWKTFEEVHKKYVKKLEDVFKAAETAILK